MFDPYHKWLGIPKDQRPPTLYQLLGIAAGESDLEVIEEAAIRQTTHVRAYQTGPHAADCTRLLNEIAQARATLTNPAKRREYDVRLAGQQAAKAEGIRMPAAMATSRAADVFADLDTPAGPPAAVFPRVQPRARDDLARPVRGNQVLYWGLGIGGAALVFAVVLVVLLLNGGSEDKGSPLVKNDQPRIDLKVDSKKDGDPRKDDINPKKDDANRGDGKLDVNKDRDIAIDPKPLKPGPEWDHVDLKYATVMDGFVRIPPAPQIVMGAHLRHRIATRRAYGPFEMTVVARTAKDNIRLQAMQGAMIIFNWEWKPGSLAVHRPDGQRLVLGRGSLVMPYPAQEPLAPNRWYTLRWCVSEEGMEVFVDDRLVFAEKHSYDLSSAERLGVCAMTSAVDVKSFVVKELPRLAKKTPPLAEPPVLPGDTPLDQLDAAKVPPEDRHAPFGDNLVAVLKGHTGQVFAVTFAPDGKFLASTGNDGKVIVWPLTPAEPGRVIFSGGGSLAGVAISPDSRRLAFATRTHLLIWDVGKWDKPAEQLQVEPMKSIPESMAWSRDNKLAFGRGNRIYLYDFAAPNGNGALRGSADFHTAAIWRVALSGDGKLLATSAYDMTVRLWDPTAPNLRPHDKREAGSPVKGIAVSPDGTKVVGICYNGSIHLWDLVAKNVTFTQPIKGQISLDTSVAFSPDGKSVLSTGGNGKAVDFLIWRKVDSFLTPHAEWMLPERSSQVVFDATGRYAALTSHNRKVYILRLPTR